MSSEFILVSHTTNAESTKIIRPRVLHLTFAHTPFDVRIFEKEAVSLTKAGFEVVLGVPIPEGTSLRDGEVRQGVRFRHLKRPRGMSGYWRRLHTAARLVHEVNPTLVHIHDPELVPLRWLLRASTPIIYDAHEDAPREAFTVNGGRPIRAALMSTYWRTLMEVVRRSFSGVVAAVPAIAEQFPAERTALVRNYPIFASLPLGPLPLETRPARFAYIGSISRERGLFVMLDAMLRLPPSLAARLTLIGSFSHAEQEAEARSHPGWAFVDYQGWQRWAEAIAALDEVRAGLLVLRPDQSFQVALPVKLFEYLGKGVPVIHTDLHSWNELSAGAGLRVPFDAPEALAAAMLGCLDDKRIAILGREAMGRRATFLSEWSWEREAQELTTLYRRILDLSENC